MTLSPSNSAHVVTLSRRSFFSMGRRLWNSSLDETENLHMFGRDSLPHGHEYMLEVTFTGPVSTEEGIIVNLTEIKPIINKVVSLLDGTFLEAEQNFEGLQPTCENLAMHIWKHLPAQVGAGTLWRIKLQESRRTCVFIQAQPQGLPTMKVLRSYEFAAAHRLYSPVLSEEENVQRFDKCSNYYGHGHNFGLEVVVEGEPHPTTGFIIAPQILDQIVDEEVFTRFDHKHLNLDCPEFADLIPSSENLARVIFDVLKARLETEGYVLSRVGLHETQKNYFEVEA